jgi:hypothetical protein
MKDYSEILVDLRRLARQYEDAMREGRELTAWTASQSMVDCVIRLAAISWNATAQARGRSELTQRDD